MKRSLKELVGYAIEAKDGTKGKVKDFLFDEERWIVRYLEADLGGIFSEKKVLIPHSFLKEPEWNTKHFPVKLTKTDIASCPDLEKDLPVSRKYEEELSRHYKEDTYWNYIDVPPVAVPIVAAYPPRPVKLGKIISEKEINTHLRSLNEVIGYHIQAVDGQLGHIDDMIIDDTDWEIVYVLVDTHNWMPWSKKVLVGTYWMEEISYVNREIKIGLHSDTIKSAPEFNPLEPVNEVYEKQLYDYYGRPVVEVF